jgi:hypothetical protein
MEELVKINGHTIELFYSIWNGKETIKYDGTVVCNRRNLSTFSSINSFKVQEEGEEIVYEVQTLTGFFGTAGYAIRRNGIIQAHKP